MPLYYYQHPLTGKTIDLIQTMSEEHSYVDKEGVKWDRLFTSPTASIDTRIDAHNPADFVNKTKTKNYNLGQLWDKSAELSAKREKTFGKDPTKQAAAESYKKRTGKEHPHTKKNNVGLI